MKVFNYCKNHISVRRIFSGFLMGYVLMAKVLEMQYMLSRIQKNTRSIPMI